MQEADRAAPVVVLDRADKGIVVLEETIVEGEAHVGERHLHTAAQRSVVAHCGVHSLHSLNMLLPQGCGREVVVVVD